MPSHRERWVGEKSCVRTNGVVLCLIAVKSKTMNEALEAEAKLIWLCSNDCLCLENGWPWRLPMLLRILVSQETGSCFGARDLSLIGRLLLGMHMQVSWVFSRLTICNLLTNFHRQFNQIKRVVAPWVSSFSPHLIAATDNFPCWGETHCAWNCDT